MYVCTIISSGYTISALDRMHIVTVPAMNAALYVGKSFKNIDTPDTDRTESSNTISTHVFTIPIAPSRRKQEVSAKYESNWKRNEAITFIGSEMFLFTYLLAAMPVNRIVTTPLYIYKHTVHTYIHIGSIIHTFIYKQTYTHTYIHTYIHTYVHTQYCKVVFMLSSRNSSYYY